MNQTPHRKAPPASGPANRQERQAQRKNKGQTPPMWASDDTIRRRSVQWLPQSDYR